MADAPQIVRRNFRQYDRDQGHAGILFPTGPGWAYGTPVVGTGSRGWVARGVPSRSMRIAAITFQTTLAATTDDPCAVAIYDSTIGASAPIVTSGAVTGKLNAVAGVQSVSITPTTLAAGKVYYAAFSYGAVGGTAATLVIGTFISGQTPAFLGSAFPDREHDAKASMHPLSATWGAVGNVTAAFLPLGLIEG